MKKTPTILIVDDNPKNLAVLGNIVTENGYIPGFATNGIQALDAVTKESPDLILLDVMMPEMDGFETCRRLKQDAKLADIPVIFLTAKTETDDIIMGLELGAVDYVAKPFNKRELLTRVKTHLELQATKQELQEALATKAKLFSIIGHDLGNIFSGLQSITEYLVDEGAQSDAKELEYSLNILKQAAKNGYDLLRNLLNWSRTQTGSLQANLTTLILHNVVNKNVELQANKAAGKEINLVADVDEHISVIADKDMLDTTLRNLISNAIKFTPASGTIQITAKPIENNLIEISVADTGVGIKNVDKLFQINTTSTNGTAGEKGNGLGLVLCKELIEKCGGTIGVDSEVGKGSRFYIQLPVNDEL